MSGYGLEIVFWVTLGLFTNTKSLKNDCRPLREYYDTYISYLGVYRHRIYNEVCILGDESWEQ